MICLRKPSAAAIDDFIAAQSQLEFTQPSVGATLRVPFKPPAGFDVDHTRVKLGSGAQTFAAAKKSLAAWRHYKLGWLEICPECPAPERGRTVASRIRYGGLWWLNACRIIDVIDEPERRFGFAFGTLPSHAECGEERFLVEWDRTDESVWYDILAFSRPNFWICRIGAPLVRRLQKQFARDSVAAMTRNPPA